MRRGRKSTVCETTQYARDVVAGKIVACRYIRLACERHLNDLKRADVWFDREAAEDFFTFCGYLRHYKGPLKGRPIELLDWQKFVFGCIYGWKKVVSGKRTHLWRFTTAYIEVPRKQGKTTIAAALAAFDCAIMEASGAEVYVAATKEEQAKVLFRDVVKFLKDSPELAEMLELKSGINTVFATGSDRTSFIKPVGANSDRLDGLNPLSVICDELHAWKGRALWDVLKGAFGARENFHMVAITTAGSNKEGICFEERKHLIDVLEGKFEADDKFGVIYTVDKGEEEKWDDPEVWAKANPSLGRGKLVSFMAAAARAVRQMPSALTEFLTKQLNVWTDAADAWLASEDWNACAAQFVPEELRGKRCHAGIDLSRTRDMSAVAYWFPVQPGLPEARLWVDFFIPATGLREKAESDRAPYDLWARGGHVITNPGRTTDFELIAKTIGGRAEMFVVEGVAFDRYFAGELVQKLEASGLKMLPHGTGFASMGNPTAEFERALINREFRHSGNPCLGWQAGNVIVLRDPSGNMKPDKTNERQRIDGIAASIMAMSGSKGLCLRKENEAERRREAIDAIGERGVLCAG